MFNEGLKLAFKGAYYTARFFTGFRISMATHYLELSRIVGYFTAPIDAIQRVMPSKMLKPVEHAPSKTVVYLAASEMRQIRLLNPYNEFGICVPVVYEESRNGSELPGIFIFSMPVTTEEARWGGVEIYGYPKFIAEITFQEDDKNRSCRVQADGMDIITLAVNKLTTEYQSKDEYAYTVREGKLIRTLFQLRGHIGTTNAVGGASFCLGNHPLVNELQKLSMDVTSIGHEYLAQAEALLHRPSKPLIL